MLICVPITRTARFRPYSRNRAVLILLSSDLILLSSDLSFYFTSSQYLYPLENIDFTLFFAIYLMIYSIFTPILSQYFQFGYFFFFLFF